RSRPRISAPICLLSGTTSNGAAPGVRVGVASCVASDMSDLPYFLVGLLRGDGDRRRRNSMGRLAARERSHNAIDQRPRRVGAELHRNAVAPALALIGEVDGEHVVEGGVVRMIEIDVGGVDLHPTFAAFGATDERRFFDDVGAHALLPYSAAMLEADAAKVRLKKSNTLRQPSCAWSGR